MVVQVHERIAATSVCARSQRITHRHVSLGAPNDRPRRVVRRVPVHASSFIFRAISAACSGVNFSPDSWSTVPSMGSVIFGPYNTVPPRTNATRLPTWVAVNLENSSADSGVIVIWTSSTPVSGLRKASTLINCMRIASGCNS